jgi:chorismate-pyruvate lyase
MLEVRRTLLGCVTLLLSLSVGADPSTPLKPLTWSDSFITRLEALALLQSLNAELLSNNSATLTLEHWCDVHHLASPARIFAERVRDTDKPASAEQRKELGVTPTEPVQYRRVQLHCGAVVLSTADNWYVPSRLTPAMNAVLDATDTPFGKAVQALRFQRHTLSSQVLWWPLPKDWEMNANGVKDDWVVSSMPRQLLQHKAVLMLPDGTPFSEVVETYPDNILRFPVPRVH